jgi:hypothetical protein
LPDGYRRQRRVCDFAKHQQQSEKRRNRHQPERRHRINAEHQRRQRRAEQTPQLRPELIVASAAILFSSPAR